MRRRFQFTTKTMLLTTVALALVLGFWFAPRVYVAHVYIGYSGIPVTGTPHPRFLKYRDQEKSDRELQLAERDWILSREVVSKAVELLEAEGVSPDVFGDDPVEWFKQRVVTTPLGEGVYVELTLSHRESSYIATGNHRRNALAWKAAVALMKAYQSNSYSSWVAKPNNDNLRLPTFNFHAVESRLW